MKTDWENNKLYNNPYQYIVNDIQQMKKDKIIKLPIYVEDFFKYLSSTYKRNQEYINNITNDETLFNNELNTEINTMCETYFNIIDEDTNIKF